MGFYFWGRWGKEVFFLGSQHVPIVFPQDLPNSTTILSHVLWLELNFHQRKLEKHFNCCLECDCGIQVGIGSKLCFFFNIVMKMYVFLCTNIFSRIYFLCKIIMLQASSYHKFYTFTNYVKTFENQSFNSFYKSIL